LLCIPKKLWLLIGTIVIGERECVVTYYKAMLNFDRAIIEHNDTCFENFKKHIQATKQMSYTFSNITKDMEKYPYDEVARNLDQAYVTFDYKKALNTVKMVGLFSSNAFLKQLIDITGQAHKATKKQISLCTDYYNSNDQAAKNKLYPKISLSIDKGDKIVESFVNKNIELAEWIYNIVKKMIVIIVLLYMACVIICCQK